MRQPHVAVLTQSTALGSIIAMILGREGDVRAQSLGSVAALEAHLRIVPADLVIADYDLGATTAPELFLSLRRNAAHCAFRSIALTRDVSRQVQQSCNFAKIDEVVIKPMSPMFLVERARVWLARSEQGLVTDPSDIDAFFEDTSADQNNVVSLFS